MIMKIVNNGLLNKGLDKVLIVRFAPIRNVLIFFVLLFVLSLYAVELLFRFKSSMQPNLG